MVVLKEVVETPLGTWCDDVPQGEFMLWSAFSQGLGSPRFGKVGIELTQLGQAAPGEQEHFVKINQP